MLQNKSILLNRSLNYAKLVEFNCFELFFPHWANLLQTGAEISKWGKCITKWVRYYKVGQGDVGQSRSIKELGKSYFTEW